MKQVSQKYADLFSDQTKAFATIATLMPDGSPQVTPVWFDTVGERIRVNTAKGRTKANNMKKGSKVALAIMDPANPYRYVQVRGTVANVTESGADAHIDRLAMKYLGKDKYPFRRTGEVRIICEIEPYSIQAQG